MVIYRSYRESLESFNPKDKEFTTKEEMLAWIVDAHTDSERGPSFALDDLVISREARVCHCTRLHDIRYVCTNRYHGNVCDPPAPIGFFVEDCN